METESTKTTGTQGEAKTGGKEGSQTEICMSCCSDASKMEEMSKLMKGFCSDPSKMEGMAKMMKDFFAGMPASGEMRKKGMGCCK